MRFAEIILPLALPKTLTYGIPEKLQGQIGCGQRVEVSFGKNKIMAGLVFELHDRKPDTYHIKSIRKLIDKTPIVSDKQLTFWRWIAAYYCATIGDVMQTALPAHLKLMNESMLVWNPAVVAIPNHLSDEAYLLAEALQIRKKLTIAEARLITNVANHADTIYEVLENQLAFIEDDLKERYQPKKETFVSLNSLYAAAEDLLAPVFDELKKAPRQSELLLQFFQLRQKEKEVPEAILLKKAGATKATLKTLVSKGVLEIYTKEISRLQPENHPEPPKTFRLNESQQQALAAIKEQWHSKPVILLQGVTGSGKTMIYIRLIQEQIKKGKQTLYLLPEIALTTHLVQKLYNYFGGELGVYHSRFNNNERVEIWKKVQDGTYKVILGARSALWLPFKNLTQIIIDEEHEHSYKQYNPAPRYQARDAAIYLAQLFQAKTLLGSATPSMESAYNVQNGKYGFAAIKERFQNQSMPEVLPIAAGNIKPSLSSLLTLPLLNAIQETLSAGKQALLFQNKRGYAPFLICAVCGHIPHCPYCEVSLTYHKATDKLHCHYCGYRAQPIKHCPKCGSNKVIARSFGTERVEEELQRIFPKRKTARMDTDSVRGKNRMQQILRDFERGSIDILVGTQMIVKGLDFENVGMVGILSADSLWSYPDFRVNERAFQIMEQVSGRAGRSAEGNGKVLIQAYNLKHPLLKWVADHDFKKFYSSEIKFRREFNYPPFSKTIRLILKHQSQAKTSQAAADLAALLRQTPLLQIQGPVPAVVSRIRNRYLFEINIKLAKNTAGEITRQKQLILQAIAEIQSKKGNSGIQIIIDVDP